MFAKIHADQLASFLNDLNALNSSIDQAYEQAAKTHGFACQGCQDSCCETRFYHHTYLEFYLLEAGLKTLSDKQYDEILDLASQICHKADIADQTQSAYRFMCPLNSDGMCSLYAYRPMICRMHGIAHTFKRPDGVVLKAPGCHVFEESCRERKHIVFDRTLFYRQMAELEKKLRSTFGLERKIKMTIAQMILAATNAK